MSKLSGLTIIPDSLYVERNADAQLRNVIERMGRPAYVLVARQMGKTNLLLHAKRTFSKPGDLFVYADVSNPFKTLTDFFQSLVDIMIEAGQFGSSVQENISALREEKNGLPPHKLHERELRLILNSISGKLVVFLDEVDALGKCDYSDEVFAYIRSIYFAARTNFPEFNRLSYVLSGVAEPSELIKNKDISPFNIGQKIYLDDFSIGELNEFCAKAEVSIPKEAIDAIFDWTNGNPRMCWDILARLDELRPSQEISGTTVSTVVNELYLTSFDLPPIDHIRDLVERNSDLSSALISIHYDKGATISDYVVNKLYLAGIAKIDPGLNKPVIRNKIIQNALSLPWLQQLETKSDTVIKRAYEAVNAQRWVEAVELLHICYDEASTIPEKNRLALDIGTCMFRARDVRQSVDWLIEHAPKKHIDARTYYESRYWIGMGYHNLGEEEPSYQSFAIGCEPSAEGVNRYFYECLVNTCVYYISNHEKNENEIQRILDSVLLEPDKIADVYGDDIKGAQHLRSIAYWNFSQLRRKQERLNDAVKILTEAIEFGDPKYLVGFYLEKARLERIIKKTNPTAEQCADLIIQQGYILERESTLYQFAFTSDNAAKLLAYLTYSSSQSILEKLYDYLSSLLKDDPEIFFSVLEYAVQYAFSYDGSENGASICSLCFKKLVESGDVGRARSFGTLAILLAPGKDSQLEELYFSNYFLKPDAIVISSDIRLVFALFNQYAEHNPNKARRILETAYRLLGDSSTPSSQPLNHAQRQIGIDIFDALSIELSFITGNIVEASHAAKKWLQRGRSEHPESMPLYVGPEIFDNLTHLMNEIAVRGAKSIPISRPHRKIGRNERVTVLLREGKEITGKYKDVVHLIQSGQGRLQLK